MRTLLAWACRIPVWMAFMVGAVACAQEYPARTIEWVVPYPAGGGTDVTARTLAVYLEKELGGSIIVVNNPGASGELALAQRSGDHPPSQPLAVTRLGGLRP